MNTDLGVCTNDDWAGADRLPEGDTRGHSISKLTDEVCVAEAEKLAAQGAH
jgi:hypothetical protein